MNHRTPSTRSHAVAAAVLALAVLALAALSPGCEDPLVQPPPAQTIDSPEEVIEALSRAYQSGDVDLLASILAHEHDTNAVYLFLLAAPTDLGETQWGYDEEIRIHQRMFQPQNPPAGDPPVPPEIWLLRMNITLTQQEPFSERTDLYTSNGGSLDPGIWRAVDARYTTYVFFDLAGMDYKVEGEANFVVVEDLRKNAGDAGKFLLLIWEDIDASALPGSLADASHGAHVHPSEGGAALKARLGVRPVSWGQVKELYK